ESNHMKVFNNVFVNTDNDPRFNIKQSIEIGSGVENGYIHHNTIWSPVLSGGACILSHGSNIPCKNNLYRGGIIDPELDTAGNKAAYSSNQFRDITGYDFDLVRARPVNRLANIYLDIMKRARPQTTSAGAYHSEESPAIENSIIGESGEPFRISLSPNPFNSSATFNLHTDKNSYAGKNITIRIFDIKGNEINSLKTPAQKSAFFTWDASLNYSGIYTAEVSFSGRREYIKALLIK
ncbi:MAG: T9SS type A sorting domain-containing protein, partial [Fibrobacterota bacterium]